METLLEQENILNVTLIEPRLKHPTIFERFNELVSGESLILLNDHDPKPLYYELSTEKGEIFAWEYLAQGPELWKVRITKNIKSEISKENILDATLLDPSVESKTVENAEKENILNVTLIEPKLKHPTIFVRFDELNPGESLIIYNDHDPKPLYYQLLGERGNIYTWEYLQEGPKLWRIKISKKLSGQGDETLGEIAAKDLRKAEVFKKYGLDFCCGGKKTVKEACAEKGLDVTKVEQELQKADQDITQSRPLPYNEWGLDFLADYISNMHHSYVRKIITDLKTYGAKVASVHGNMHPELHKMNRLTDEVCDELASHMVKEETVLFPYIKSLVAAKKDGTPLQNANFKSIQSPIDMMEHEHQSVGNKLDEIRKLGNNYSLPEDACTSYAFWFKTLNDFENDLHLHVHLENNILFPKVLDLEKEQK